MLKRSNMRLLPVIVLLSLAARGSGPGQFERPTDIAAGAGNRIYVVDYGIVRIQPFWVK